MKIARNRSRVAKSVGGMAAAFALASVVATAHAAELVMFERSGCPWCGRWDAEVASAYTKTAEGKRAPLRRHSLDKGQPTDIALERPVRYTPTFVLVDNGKEVGRMMGYPGRRYFYPEIQGLLDKLPQASN